MKTCNHCGNEYSDFVSRFPRERITEGHTYTDTYCHDCRDTAAPWRVDHAALDRARQLLGIRLPVIVVRKPDVPFGGGRGGHATGPDGKPLGDDMWTGANMRGVINATQPEWDAESSRAIGNYQVKSLPDLEEYLDPTALIIEAEPRMSAEYASMILWHELTHAAQFERDPYGFWYEYRLSMRATLQNGRANNYPLAVAIDGNVFEIVAVANQRFHTEHFPLARPNRRATLPEQNPPHPFIVSASDGSIVKGKKHDFLERSMRKRTTDAIARIKASPDVVELVP